MAAKKESKTEPAEQAVTLDVADALDDMTFADFEDFEEVTGLAIGSLGSAKGVPAKAMRGMIWLQLRRDDPDVTYDSLKNMKISAINTVGEDEEEVQDEVDPELGSDD
jgi:hypothetical protein